MAEKPVPTGRQSMSDDVRSGDPAQQTGEAPARSLARAPAEDAAFSVVTRCSRPLVLASVQLAAVLTALFPARGATSVADVFRKADTWQETLRLSREALRLREDEESKRASDSPTELAVGPWYQIGPFYVKGARGFSHVFPPEQEIDLRKRYGTVGWQAKPSLSDGIVHYMKAGSNGSTYLYRKIRAPSDEAVTGYFGSDDGLVVWLNAEKVISRDVPRGPGPNQDKAELRLRKGENHLLLKIYNISGNHGFYFSTSPKPGGKHSPAYVARQQLWSRVATEFPGDEARRQMRWEEQDGIWADDWDAGDLEELARRYVGGTRVRAAVQEATRLAASVRNVSGLARVRELHHLSRRVEAAREGAGDLQALRLAVVDLVRTFGERYRGSESVLARLEEIEKAMAGLGDAKEGTVGLDRLLDLVRTSGDVETLRREALLGNPLLDFDRLMLVRRSDGSPRLGLPQNWQGNCALPRSGYDNEIALLSLAGPDGALTTLYRPDKAVFVGDVDLHFGARRLLFSMMGRHNRWQIWEIGVDGQGLHQVTPGDHADVDNYDACYLPDGRIIFDSTRCFHGVPCVGGGNTVANLCIMNADGTGIRQLCFDQDHNWCPTVLNNGRVLYSRWEYADSPHYFTRLLFHMNPDGTGQTEYYGSNSYWPNSIFYARPIPGHASQFVAVISGHHGVARMGELILFDPARGRHEASGAIQRIPGRGKVVEPIIRDQLVNSSWPKFLHPYPLSEKYFLVSCKPRPDSLWGIYLVDVFDNMLLLKEAPGQALLEPVPLRETRTPPVIPDRVRLDRQDAVVHLSDVYAGPGLAGVPRGTVKRLRVYEYHYAYPRMGGHIHVGIDGPWDVHRIHGTVPVLEDGSAFFVVPANVPLAVQPLDSRGRALQVMRSWFTAMPGEVLSCVGCHESQSSSPPGKLTLASRRPPAAIDPWRGPPRGFSFKREVQPVLDRACVSCHNGKPHQGGVSIPDLTARAKGGWRNFTPSYVALHPYVRRAGPENDYHLQNPLEFHASTSELVQMLEKGHHGVELDDEGWDRLITWIDLNVPDHGSWSEHRGIHGNLRERRVEMRSRFAGRPEDPEVIPQTAAAPSDQPGEVVPPERPRTARRATVKVGGWPFGEDAAKKRQQQAGVPAALSVDIGDGAKLDLVLVPAGEFAMGDPNGAADERPLRAARIAKPLYMGEAEVTNAQYGLFAPGHDSGYISMTNKDQSVRGHPVNGPRQPVVRVSWDDAVAFCAWLSGRTGLEFSLPTEAQWEWACRAGSSEAFSFGAPGADFAAFGNMADRTMAKLARRDSPKWHLRDDRFDDKAMVTAEVGRYRPNAWGLHDMHGNVCEWTCTPYRSYSVQAGDGPGDDTSLMTVRGGSWYDRPKRCRSAFRLAYPRWQRVYNTGFRVVCRADRKVAGRVPRRSGETE